MIQEIMEIIMSDQLNNLLKQGWYPVLGCILNHLMGDLMTLKLKPVT